MEKNRISIAAKYRMALLFLAMTLACNHTSSFEGSYVNRANSEFSVADDTLEVTQVEPNQFLLKRSTGFRLLDDAGKPGRLKIEKEEWTAVYDADRGV